jgi:hypothetical protein
VIKPEPISKLQLANIMRTYSQREREREGQTETEVEVFGEENSVNTISG